MAASLAGACILKLDVWSDRGSSNPKDAHDLYPLMTKYVHAENADRLHEAGPSLVKVVGYDPEVAGACLLGKGAAILVNESTYDNTS